MQFVHFNQKMLQNLYYGKTKLEQKVYELKIF